jgi:colanic acid biosynthesis glycosyl transferase WcaI
MRLLIVSQYFWPENFRVNELVTDLVARGHDVTVLTGRPNYPQGQLFDEYRVCPSLFSCYSGAEVLRVPMRPRGQGKVRLMLNYLSFLTWGLTLGPWLLRGRSFDAVFIFSTSPITSALPGLLIGALKRAPVALWVLDLWPETLSAVGAVKSSCLLGLVGKMVGLIYRRCSLILVQSRAFCPSVERWAGTSLLTRYFPGWVEGIFERTILESPVAQELLPYKNTFNVMFAGNIGEAQDFPSILKAAYCLRHRDDIRWLIVGNGRAAESVRVEIARSGLDRQVILVGHHPLDRMPSFFRGADALLVSLKADAVFAMTIPGKVQNCLAAGLPVLGMLDGEGARVIGDSKGGLSVASGDADGLASLVEHMAGMSAEDRHAMGRRGREYALQEFSRRSLIDRLDEYLSAMVNVRNI